MTEILPVLGIGAIIVDAGVWFIQLVQRATGNMIHVLANRFMILVLIISPLAETWYLVSQSSDFFVAPIACIFLTVSRRFWHTTRFMNILDFVKEACSFAAKVSIVILLTH